MRFQTKALMASLILASASNVFAASTADLKVIGTVIPGACTPVFAGGATVDYGNISAGDLSATAVQALQTRQISYTITCDAPIAIATAWLDNRASSVTVPAPTRFGLGTQGTNNIGYYGITIAPSQTLADGVAVDTIVSEGGGGAWVAGTTGGLTSIIVNGASNRVYSYAATGTLTPVAGTTYSGALTVRAWIAPTDTLDMTAPIVLDGLSTMEVRYL